MTKFAILMSSFALITAGPLLAHEHRADKSGEHKCEMMKDGKKMSGMMKKDADGKMSCQMMDHSKMDHSKMDHSKMPAPKRLTRCNQPWIIQRWTTRRWIIARWSPRKTHSTKHMIGSELRFARLRAAYFPILPNKFTNSAIFSFWSALLPEVRASSTQ